MTAEAMVSPVAEERDISVESSDAVTGGRITSVCFRRCLVRRHCGCRSRCETFGERANLIRRCNASQTIAVLGQESLDAIVVATPTRLHYEIARKRWRPENMCSWKAVVPDGIGGEELVRLARQRGVVLMVGQVFLFHNGIAKLKEFWNREKRASFITSGPRGRIWPYTPRCEHAIRRTTCQSSTGCSARVRSWFRGRRGIPARRHRGHRVHFVALSK